MFIVHLTYLSSSVCRKYLKNLVYLTLLSCCFLLFSYYSWPLVQETGKGGGGITGHFFASNDWYNMKKGKKKASKPCDEWDARKKKKMKLTAEWSQDFFASMSEKKRYLQTILNKKMQKRKNTPNFLNFFLFFSFSFCARKQNGEGDCRKLLPGQLE